MTDATSARPTLIAAWTKEVGASPRLLSIPLATAAIGLVTRERALVRGGLRTAAVYLFASAGRVAIRRMAERDKPAENPLLEGGKQVLIEVAAAPVIGLAAERAAEALFERWEKAGGDSAPAAA